RPLRLTVPEETYPGMVDTIAGLFESPSPNWTISRPSSNCRIYELFVGGPPERNLFAIWRKNGFQFHCTPADAMLQRLPVPRLHGDNRPAVLLANVVDGANVRMVQRGSGLRFALNRASACGSRARLSGRNFRATKRCRRTSSALYTTPIPPP